MILCLDFMFKIYCLRFYVDVLFWLNRMLLSHRRAGVYLPPIVSVKPFVHGQLFACKCGRTSPYEYGGIAHYADILKQTIFVYFMVKN